MNIEKEIYDLISTKLKIPIDVLSIDTSLVDNKDFKLDSIDMHELILSVELFFDIEFKNYDIGSFKTIGDIVSQVLKKLNNGVCS